MVKKNSRWTWNHFTWMCLLAMLASPVAEAASKLSPRLKPGSVCTLQSELKIRNKAQRRNVKITKLSKGDTFKIVRYHRVWVRIRVNGNIAFAAPQGLKELCTPEPVTPITPKAPSPAPKPAPEPTPLAAQPEPVVAEPEKPEPVKTQEATPKAPMTDPAPKPQKTPTVQIPAVQAPDLNLLEAQTESYISPIGWVALGTGAAGLGTAAYFVTQLTEQDEAKTGQYALLAGTAGIIAVVVGFSYVLYPEKRPKTPKPASEGAVSAEILLGPNSIGVAGKF